MKRIALFMALVSMLLPSVAQDGGRTLKPNYRKIARLVRDASGPYYLPSLQERFAADDTTLTVDDLRCLYYGGGTEGLDDSFQRYLLLSGRFGRQSRQANAAWTRYQLLTTAVWSTGDGSRRRPLHVLSCPDAEAAAVGYTSPLWFKIKGKRKFCVSPQP